MLRGCLVSLVFHLKHDGDVLRLASSRIVTKDKVPLGTTDHVIVLLKVSVGVKGPQLLLKL